MRVLMPIEKNHQIRSKKEKISKMRNLGSVVEKDLNAAGVFFLLRSENLELKKRL